MANLFGTLNISKQGMMAQSFAVKTTSHNISNVNTAGYSRQRVNLQASSYYSYPGIGQFGTGVEITGVQRIRDQFLDEQINYQISILSRHQASRNVLDQIENVLLEPSDTGLKSVMSDMWDSWQNLGNYPEKSNTKTDLAQTSRTFTETLNHMAKQLDTLKKDTITNIEGTAYNANQMINQIKEISDQIYKMELKNLTPNDLYDRRDLYVEELSSIINIDVEYDKFSRIKITEADTGQGRVLLDFDTEAPVTNELSVIKEAKDVAGGQEVTVSRGGDITKTYTFIIPTTTPPVSFQEGETVYVDPKEWKTYDGNKTTPPTLKKADLKEGELAGNKASIAKINQYHKELDRLAFALAETINLVHHATLASDPTTIDPNSKAFFTTSDGSGVFNASNIQVNQDILNNPEWINAGVNASSNDGDTSRAIAIAQLRYASLQLDHTDFETTYLDTQYDMSTMEMKKDVKGTSFDDYYENTIAKVGIDTKQAKDGVEQRAKLLLSLTQRRESISGVSIDEEVTNLIQFQHAYQANAKVISTLTDMLDVLINRLGV